MRLCVRGEFLRGCMHCRIACQSSLLRTEGIIKSFIHTVGNHCCELMAYLIRILALLFGFSSLELSTQTICNATPYGQLRKHQCLTLCRDFADSSDNQLRIFDEEQLREGEGRSWPGIVNPFRTKVVQVPRFWTSRTCHEALAQPSCVACC